MEPASVTGPSNGPERFNQGICPTSSLIVASTRTPLVEGRYFISSPSNARSHNGRLPFMIVTVTRDFPSGEIAKPG